MSLYVLSGLHTANQSWQTRVGKLKSVCVNGAKTVGKHVGKLLATNRTRLPTVFAPHRSHTPTWVCQHEFANFSLPCEGRFRETFLCFLHQFHRAFCPSSLFVLALQMKVFKPKSVDCLRVIYDIVWFCPGKSSEFKSSSYDCSSSSTLWSSLISLRCCQVFLRLFSSPSFVRRLVTLSFLQYCGFGPSRSHQLPIAGSDGDQCSLTLRIWRIFLFRFFRNETVLFSVQGWTIYIVICNNPIRIKFVIVNVIATEYRVPDISIAALFENEGLRLQLSFLNIKIHKQTTNWTSIRIVIVKRNFNLFWRWRDRQTTRFVHYGDILRQWNQ